MIRVDFYLYNALAGDPQELLVGRAKNGNRKDVLFNRSLPFEKFRLKLAIKRLLKDFNKNYSTDFYYTNFRWIDKLK
jgi:hypothetical protein